MVSTQPKPTSPDCSTLGVSLASSGAGIKCVICRGHLVRAIVLGRFSGGAPRHETNFPVRRHGSARLLSPLHGQSHSAKVACPCGFVDAEFKSKAHSFSNVVFLKGDKTSFDG